MRRLYFRIYLAVLGSLALFAVLAGIGGWAFREFHEADPGFGARGEFVADIADHLFPQNADPSAIARELQFWHEKTGYSFAILASSGSVIAQAGALPESMVEKFRRARGLPVRWSVWQGVFSAPLRDGRRVLAFWPSPHPAPLRHVRWLGILFAVGLAVAVCAFPVVRGLTRNLERLERGVAAFGRGNLDARVSAKGSDEVARLAATFNASADRIEALVKAQRILLANASHELRSPLARLRMAVEATGAAEPKAAREEINRNIAELDEMIDEILLSSRLDTANGLDREQETVDLIGLLAEECASFHADLSVTPGATLLVKGNARLLRRLFRNLLENAVRYGGSGVTQVMAGRDGAAAIVSVCDRGPGVPEAERDRIFQPFYRLKGFSERDRGTGLGLALVRQIAERHGGSVLCRPREGGGACFTVTLPLHSEAIEPWLHPSSSSG
jgi:signal transduction histidine kinase